MTRTINIYEAKTHFSRLVDAVEAGEEIIIARNGKPCVKLVPLPPPLRGQVELGFLRGMVPAEDIGDNLLDPLYSEQDLAGFESALLASLLEGVTE